MTDKSKQQRQLEFVANQLTSKIENFRDRWLSSGPWTPPFEIVAPVACEDIGNCIGVYFQKLYDSGADIDDLGTTIVEIMKDAFIVIREVARRHSCSNEFISQVLHTNVYNAIRSHVAETKRGEDILKRGVPLHAIKFDA